MNGFILGESSCVVHTHTHTHIKPDNDATQLERFFSVSDERGWERMFMGILYSIKINHNDDQCYDRKIIFVLFTRFSQILLSVVVCIFIECN